MMRQTKPIDVKIIEVKAIALGLAMSRAPADYLCKSCTYPSIYAVVFNAPPKSGAPAAKRDIDATVIVRESATTDATAGFCIRIHVFKKKN